MQIGLHDLANNQGRLPHSSFKNRKVLRTKAKAFLFAQKPRNCRRRFSARSAETESAVPAGAYSLFNAIKGSTCVARKAGKEEARRTTTARTDATARKTLGS